MTTLIDFDFKRVFETVKDRPSLEMVHRVIQAEANFHEARLSQLKEMSSALEERIDQIR